MGRLPAVAGTDASGGARPFYSGNRPLSSIRDAPAKHSGNVARSREKRQTKTAEFRTFLDEVVKDGGHLERLSTAGSARLVPAAMNTLRRDLRERGPILKLSLADRRGGADARRVYRVEEKDMVEFYSVSYSVDSRIDDIDLFSEY